ncbi:Glucosamine 6-phosphate N-acetyltransferase [Cyphellophora attinorum]|uniref:Glucosamine 6-phosphate N-acetyltransferase n=1 Tax=Cyphellophora attinorum TaxID=1664694 RepID=A0A0N0NJQ3_9EURO|nr:Glucosamine 6-phosphate N-acetyltransferase [Phialophora attinorum]KPI36919.1 Glucosamine 6-phosphate N-acetyltransferase [Phialophora attinorum]
MPVPDAVPEQSLSSSEIAQIRGHISKASTPAETETRTPASIDETNGNTTAAEPADNSTPPNNDDNLPVVTAEEINTAADAATEGLVVTTAEEINGTTQQSTVDDAAPVPLQALAGEPNGTNGIEQTTEPEEQVETADPAKEVKAEADDEETPLFSPDLISPEVASLLPEGYIIRPLRRSDYHKGNYHTLVILDPSLPPTSSIVGTGSVLVERKFIHNMGLVGHIEDIAVAKNQQGKKLGLRIIQALDYVAEKVGCYKCILDCSEANEGFYVKCGFKRAGLEMAHYYGR